MFLKSSDIEREFGVKLITSEEMESAIKLWDSVFSGDPPWLNPQCGIESVNMAKHIADTRAKLTSLDIGIAVSGSERAEFLQSIVDSLIDELPAKLSEADGLGGMIIKWNGRSWDFIMPGSFGITDKNDSGLITGAVFAAYAEQNGEHYTKLEYHRFEGDDENGPVYTVTNRAFKNRRGISGQTELGLRVPLKAVREWAHLEDEVRISNLKFPLFAYYRLPGANITDRSSPLGSSCFSGALVELKAIDVAVSRKNSEVEDSTHITFVGQTVVRNAKNKDISLPRFVMGLGMGIDDGETTAVKEHVPTMLTEQRIKDINFDLSMAGVKCGFSEGVFVLNGQTGMITATQVEADDRDTIQTIKSDRDALKTALQQAIKGADALITLYKLAPIGLYELEFNFGDITYNYSEDQQRWYSYVTQGYVPFWYYLTKFEGFSVQEAKKLASAAEQKTEKGLFEEE